MKNFSILFVMMLSAGCTFNHEDRYFDDIVCDTVNLKYSQINAILQANCVSCHSVDFNNRDIVLDNYEGVQAAVNSGLLTKAVNHLSGVTPMPYGKEILPNCELSKINKWIEKGMPQ
jgi:hypothetical protein